MTKWTLIVIATTAAGHVAIHETEVYGSPEEINRVADNLIAANPYVTTSVTVFAQRGPA